MARDIIIKPVISEKAETKSGKLNQYTFIVDKSANKLEIVKAVSAMFPEVTVKSVNTLTNPGKLKTRNTKSGVVKGMTSPKKKAIVTLAEGETLELYGTAEE